MLSRAKFATLMPIRNMNRAIRFYTKSLGGRVLMRAPGEMRDEWASVKVGSEEFWLITPSKREKRTVAYSAFMVGNIRNVVRGLAKKGVKFEKAERMSPETKIDGPIATEPWGKSAFFKDTEGNLLMLWQNVPEM
jgi:catechol 2,3-dioxygenase-like lactoylglutathione lyase family enzyme